MRKYILVVLMFVPLTRVRPGRSVPVNSHPRVHRLMHLLKPAHPTLSHPQGNRDAKFAATNAPAPLTVPTNAPAPNQPLAAQARRRLRSYRPLGLHQR